MKKIVVASMMCLLLGITGCNTKVKEEAMAQTTEIVSELGEISFTLNGYWGIKTSEELEKIKVSNSQFCDLEFYHTQTGSGVSIIYDDLTKTQGGTLVRMEDYVAAIRDSLENSKEYTYHCSEISSDTLHEKEYMTFSAKVSEQEGMQYYYIRRIDNQMMIMIFNLYGEDQLEDIINLSGIADN